MLNKGLTTSTSAAEFLRTKVPNPRSQLIGRKSLAKLDNYALDRLPESPLVLNGISASHWTYPTHFVLSSI